VRASAGLEAECPAEHARLGRLSGAGVGLPLPAEAACACTLAR